jgi:hypothetical protein
LDAGLKALAGWRLTSSRTQNPWSGGYSFGPHRTGTGRMERAEENRETVQAPKRWEFIDSLRPLMRREAVFSSKQTNANRTSYSWINSLRVAQTTKGFAHSLSQPLVSALAAD